MDSIDQQQTIGVTVDKGNNCLERGAAQQKNLIDLESTVDTVFFLLKDLRRILEKERKGTDCSLEHLRREISRLKGCKGPASVKKKQNSMEKINNYVSHLYQHGTSFRNMMSHKVSHVIEGLHDLERLSASNLENVYVDDTTKRPNNQPAVVTGKNNNTRFEKQRRRPSEKCRPTKSENGWSTSSALTSRNNSSQELFKVNSKPDLQTADRIARINSRSPFTSKFLNLVRSRSMSPKEQRRHETRRDPPHQRPATVLGIYANDDDPTGHILFPENPKILLDYAKQGNLSERTSSLVLITNGTRRSVSPVNGVEVFSQERNTSVEKYKATNTSTYTTTKQRQLSDVPSCHRLSYRKLSLKSDSLQSLIEQPEEEQPYPVLTADKSNSNSTVESQSLVTQRDDTDTRHDNPNFRHSLQSHEHSTETEFLDTNEETKVNASRHEHVPQDDNTDGRNDDQTKTEQECENPIWIRKKGSNVLKRANTMDSTDLKYERDKTLRRLGFLSPQLTSVPVRERSFIGSRIQNLVSECGILSQSTGSLQQSSTQPSPVPTYVMEALQFHKSTGSTLDTIHHDDVKPGTTEANLKELFLVPPLPFVTEAPPSTNVGDPFYESENLQENSNLDIDKITVEFPRTSTTNMQPRLDSDSCSKIPSSSPATSNSVQDDYSHVGSHAWYAGPMLQSEENTIDMERDDMKQIHSPLMNDISSVDNLHHSKQDSLDIPSRLVYSTFSDDQTASSPAHQLTPRKLSRLSNRSRSLSPSRFPDRELQEPSLNFSSHPVKGHIEIVDIRPVGGSTEVLGRLDASLCQNKIESTVSTPCLSRSVDGSMYRLSSTTLMPDHKTPCCFHSAVVLDNGLSVLVDKSHRRLELLDSDGHLCHDFRIVDLPGGVCAFGKTRFVVAMPDQLSLRLFRVVHNQVRLQKEVKVDCSHGPVDVCYQKQWLFALCRGGHVHVLDVNGKHEAILNSGLPGATSVRVNSPGDMIYILQDGRVVCFDKEGDIIWRRNDGYVKGMDIRGDKLVVVEQKTVISLLPNGVSEGDIIVDEIDTPFQVAIANDGQQLIVTQYTQSMPKNKTRAVKIFHLSNY